jgi:hypothetical protein
MYIIIKKTVKCSNHGYAFVRSLNAGVGPLKVMNLIYHGMKRYRFLVEKSYPWRVSYAIKVVLVPVNRETINQITHMKP